MSWVRGETGLRRHIQGSSRARGHHGGGALRPEDRQSLASLVVRLHLSVSPRLEEENGLLSQLTPVNIGSSFLTAKFFWGQFRSFTDNLKRNFGQFFFTFFSGLKNMFCLERCQMVIFEKREMRVLCREILITEQK